MSKLVLEPAAPRPVLLLSTADTELLAARGVRRALPHRQPRPASSSPGCPRCSTGPSSWCCGCSAAAAPGRRASTRCGASGLPVVLLGGEAAPDAELMALSTVPGRGRGGGAAPTCVEGGTDNLARAGPLPLRHGAARPARASRRRAPMPEFGVHGARAEQREDRPTVGVVFYRAHELSRQHRVRRHPVRRDRGRAAPTRCRCSAARCAVPTTELLALLGRADALVVDRAGRRRHRRRRRVGGRRRRGLGRRARSPRWTSRCCRGCA